MPTVGTQTPPVFVSPICEEFIVIEDDEVPGAPFPDNEPVSKPIGWYVVTRAPFRQQTFLGFWKGTWAQFQESFGEPWIGSGAHCKRVDHLGAAYAYWVTKFGDTRAPIYRL